jgi:hypothetical protein
MRNIYKYKDWEKAYLENNKMNSKRTSIKRLYLFIENNYNKIKYDDNPIIDYFDNDPSFEYEINIPKNKYIKSGKYTIGYTLEYDTFDEDDDANSYREYYMSVDNNHFVENSHKQIPFIINSLKKIFGFID